MSRIDITHAHSLSPESAREAIEKMAASLNEKFKVTTQWAGDVLSFNGSGVDGRITLAQGAVNVAAELSFPVSMMKGMVESEIQRVLKEKLG